MADSSNLSVAFGLLAELFQEHQRDARFQIVGVPSRGGSSYAIEVRPQNVSYQPKDFLGTKTTLLTIDVHGDFLALDTVKRPDELCETEETGFEEEGEGMVDGDDEEDEEEEDEETIRKRREEAVMAQMELLLADTPSSLLDAVRPTTATTITDETAAAPSGSKLSYYFPEYPSVSVFGQSDAPDCFTVHVPDLSQFLQEDMGSDLKALAKWIASAAALPTAADEAASPLAKPTASATEQTVAKAVCGIAKLDLSKTRTPQEERAHSLQLAVKQARDVLGLEYWDVFAFGCAALSRLAAQGDLLSARCALQENSPGNRTMDPLVRVFPDLLAAVTRPSLSPTSARLSARGARRPQQSDRFDFSRLSSVWALRLASRPLPTDVVLFDFSTGEMFFGKLACDSGEQIKVASLYETYVRTQGDFEETLATLSI